MKIRKSLKWGQKVRKVNIKPERRSRDQGWGCPASPMTAPEPTHAQASSHLPMCRIYARSDSCAKCSSTLLRVRDTEIGTNAIGPATESLRRRYLEMGFVEGRADVETR